MERLSFMAGEIDKNKAITIDILKWEKFNPRKDIKISSWFRMEHNIFENPDFFDFSHSDFMFWIYLLAIASKKNCGSINLNVRHAERIGRFSHSEIVRALDLLEINGTIKVTVKDEVHVTSTSRASNVLTLELFEHERYERDETLRDETNVRGCTGKKPARPPKLSTLVWEAYSEEMQAKYKAAPERHAKANGQIKTFLQQVPEAEAIALVRFYVNHPNQFYGSTMHSIGVMLQDASKLLLEMRSGQFAPSYQPGRGSNGKWLTYDEKKRQNTISAVDELCAEVGGGDSNG